MKYLIATDLEGIHGVFGDAYKTLTDSSDYGRAVEGAVLEINRAVSALFDEGAELVAVWDNHGAGKNIDFSKIDPRAVRIDTAGDVYRFDFAKCFGFDRIIFLGYHAREGTPKGILAHSYSSVGIQYIKLDGVAVGELGVDSLICADYGIAPAFIASDDVCVGEMKGIAPGIHTVITKIAEGRDSGTPRPEEQVLTEIYEGVRAAARDGSLAPISKMRAPIPLEIRYTRAERAAEKFALAEKLGIPVRYGDDTHILHFEINEANRIPKLI